MNSIRGQLETILGVLFHPRDAFRKVQLNPSWVTSFVVNGILAMLLAIAEVPLAERLARLSLPDTAPPEAFESLLAIHLIQTVASLIALPLQWLLFSGILFAVVVSMEWDWPEFKAIYSVVSFSHIVLSLRDIVTTAGVALRGVDSVRSIADMNIIPSLGRLLEGEFSRHPMAASLNAIDPFAIWHIAVLGIGVSVLTRRAVGETIWAPILMWLIVVLAGASMALLV